MIKHHLWTILLMNQKSQPQWQWPPSSPQWWSKEWRPISIGVDVQSSCTTILTWESLEIEVDQSSKWSLGPRFDYHQWFNTTKSTFTNSIDNSTHLRYSCLSHCKLNVHMEYILQCWPICDIILFHTTCYSKHKKFDTVSLLYLTLAPNRCGLC